MPIGGDTFLSIVTKSMAFDWSLLTKMSIQFRTGTSHKEMDRRIKVAKRKDYE